MKTLTKKHPLAIRWFHWINFPVLFLMIWSGLLIYWSNAVYRIGLGSYTLSRNFLSVIREIVRVGFGFLDLSG
jgi:hypothetical protein